MAWDETKGPGDGLPSSEWNNHVDDQKNNKTITQSSQPPVGPAGQAWAELVEVLGVDETIVTASSLGTTEVTSNGEIVYADNGTNEIVIYDIDTGTEVGRDGTHGNSIRDLDVAERDNVIYSVSNESDAFRVVVTDLTDGTNIRSTFPSTTGGVDGANCIAAYDRNVGWVGTYPDDRIIKADGSFDSSGFITIALATNYTVEGEIESIATDSSNNIYCSVNGTTDGIASFQSSGSERWSVSKSWFGDVMWVFEDRLFTSYSGTKEIDTSTGSELWSYANDGNLGWDYVNDVLYIIGTTNIYSVDPADGSELTSQGTPEGRSPDWVGRYSGTTYVGDEGENDVTTYTTLNEFVYYVSDGNRWMNSNQH